MRLVKRVREQLEDSSQGYQLLHDAEYRSIAKAVFSLIANLMYAFYNGFLGITTHSYWFRSSCFYYLLLCAMRFTLILCRRSKREKTVMAITGVLLTGLSVVLVRMQYLSFLRDVAKQHHEIVMITISAYTFAKITLAIVRAVGHRKNPSALMVAVRNISYAEVVVSVLTMQRSMLVSFGELKSWQIHTFNIFTGAGVCFFTLALGVLLIRKAVRKDEICGKVARQKSK